MITMMFLSSSPQRPMLPLQSMGVVSLLLLFSLLLSSYQQEVNAFAFSFSTTTMTSMIQKKKNHNQTPRGQARGQARGQTRLASASATPYEDNSSSEVDDGGLATYLDFLNTVASSSSSSSSSPAASASSSSSFQGEQAPGTQEVQYSSSSSSVQQVQEQTTTMTQPSSSFLPDSSTWLPQVPPEVEAMKEYQLEPLMNPTTKTKQTKTNNKKKKKKNGKKNDVIFSIQEPIDLLEFLAPQQDTTTESTTTSTTTTNDICVIKVWASWCKSCQGIESKYRKLANDYYSTSSSSSSGGTTTNIRFAELEYTPSQSETQELIHQLQSTKLPHILIYQNMILQSQFICLPKDFQSLLINHPLLVAVQQEQQVQQQEQQVPPPTSSHFPSSSSSSPPLPPPSTRLRP